MVGGLANGVEDVRGFPVKAMTLTLKIKKDK